MGALSGVKMRYHEIFSVKMKRRSTVSILIYRFIFDSTSRGGGEAIPAERWQSQARGQPRPGKLRSRGSYYRHRQRYQ